MSEFKQNHLFDTLKKNYAEIHEILTRLKYTDLKPVGLEEYKDLPKQKLAQYMRYSTVLVTHTREWKRVRGQKTESAWAMKEAMGNFSGFTEWEALKRAEKAIKTTWKDVSNPFKHIKEKS